MEIKNNLLFVDGKQVPFRKSPNIGGKIKGHRFLIIHYTGAATAESAIGWMEQKQSKVSAHIHEDRSGLFVQQVPFDVVAWHAGESKWKDVIGINSWSIGIEIQNTGKQEYTKAQLDELIKVAKVLVAEYGIEEILGHSDIAPGRKVDPGPQFPMQWFRAQVYGGTTEITVASKNTTTDVNLREGAGTNFKAIQVINIDTEVNILSEKDGWSEVFICDLKLKGWIKSNYLS